MFMGAGVGETLASNSRILTPRSLIGQKSARTFVLGDIIFEMEQISISHTKKRFLRRVSPLGDPPRGPDVLLTCFEIKYTRILRQAIVFPSYAT